MQSAHAFTTAASGRSEKLLSARLQRHRRAGAALVGMGLLLQGASLSVSMVLGVAPDAALFVVGGGLLSAGMSHNAQARGRSRAWGLLGLLSVVGFVPLVLLATRCLRCGRPGPAWEAVCADCAAPLG